MHTHTLSLCLPPSITLSPSSLSPMSPSHPSLSSLLFKSNSSTTPACCDQRAYWSYQPPLSHARPCHSLVAIGPFEIQTRHDGQNPMPRKGGLPFSLKPLTSHRAEEN